MSKRFLSVLFRKSKFAAMVLLLREKAKKARIFTRAHESLLHMTKSQECLWNAQSSAPHGKKTGKNNFEDTQMSAPQGKKLIFLKD